MIETARQIYMEKHGLHWHIFITLVLLSSFMGRVAIDMLADIYAIDV